MGSLLASALAFGAGGAAWAQGQIDNLEKLLDFKTTGTPLQMQYVDQQGPKAAQIRKNLERVKLPPGFKIGLYAVVPDARHMAVGRSVGSVWVGTRKTSVYVATDRGKDRVADEVMLFASSIAFKIPNGPCISPDGVLYLAEHNRVLAFGAAEFFSEGPDVAVGIVVPQGRLIPPEEESFNHRARVCRIGPDNKLYISLGQPYNVTPPAKVEKYAELGIGGIIRMDRDGKNREVFARGIRNSVGFDFDPASGRLWFTDNQVDGMGDDIPPGELNRHPARVGRCFGGAGTMCRSGWGRWCRLAAACGGALGGLALPASAEDAAAGRQKARMCQTCHGIDGVARRPDVPNIGGESTLYLTRQLEAFARASGGTSRCRSSPRG